MDGWSDVTLASRRMDVLKKAGVAPGGGLERSGSDPGAASAATLSPAR
jgi:hypothetical protein